MKCGLALVGACLILGLAHSGRRLDPAVKAAGAQDKSSKDSLTELAVPRTDIKRLQDMVPDQAHAMISVAYNFNNLWFAAKAKNWTLAEFYWGETRSHLRWAVRIIPLRKNAAKENVDLREILKAVENGPLKQLQDAVKARNDDKLVAAYKFTLEGCYSCHKASEKAYLRPRIPERPAEGSINFDPKADWPK